MKLSQIVKDLGPIYLGICKYRRKRRLQLDMNNTVTLLDNWEHFDPEGTRVQKFLRAFADHPSNESLRIDAERVLASLPLRVQNRLQQLATTAQ